MKPKAKKYLITEESHEILVVRRKGRAPSRVRCSQCGTAAEMLTADAAVTCSGRSSRELFRRIEAGLLHSVETDTGHVLICSVSLARFGTINDTADRKTGKD